MEQPKIHLTPADKHIVRPVNKFISKSTTGGIVLFIAALIAIFFANSEWSEEYNHFWHQHIVISLGEFSLDLSLHHWINDGLMAIFFFVVGLELKRELTNGELASPKKAMLPIIAAIGGMVFPALIYTFFNNGTDAAHGWGIPMATDIAFALGVMYLLGNKVPLPLKVFLTALAIVDDLGAVLVIAIFYTNELHMGYLSLGLGIFALMLFSNKMGVKSIIHYAILGIGGVWLCFLMSGVHATIAAVLAAFTIPASARVNESYFVYKMRELRDKFLSIDPDEKHEDLTDEQIRVVEDMHELTRETIPPSLRLEHGMHSFVSFIVMPIFALCNAAIPISFDNGLSLVTIGVILGLLLGKVLGIFGLLGALIKLKIVKKTEGLSMKNLLGVAFLASIGFTMSLFITELAFDTKLHPEYVPEAKMGIIIASLIGGIVGYLILNTNKEEKKGGENI
ncbi:sodium/proton antiporter, NhaA family [Riemerella anatipestifer ATCC 11845 = DSM 15868]|uniref:Na+/H+ antiporter NhaA n=1 Tax=Riemerella anatipestifer TaxID=34085 RepID=UPI0001EC53A8|nr:Na+/H+ antiporter NhaA [Riemerella anatipestifer]ADQ81401.1 sodium/proton antiporter, NhaA family [Riemerella anatipestifer ATCC 11845 = DSM 15868]